MAIAKCFDDLNQLDQINWELFFEQPQLDGYCQYWKSVHTVERWVKRMETRQAEFLVHEHVPLASIEEVVARTPEIARNVANLLGQHSWNVSVRHQPLWSY